FTSERSQSFSCPPEAIQCWGSHCAGGDDTILFKGNETSPNRHSAKKVSGAINRINNPSSGWLSGRITGLESKLFSKDRIARTVLVDELHHCFFYSTICVSNV